MSAWLIWSEEHGAWWKKSRQGYTRSLKKAGRYSKPEALQICQKANAPYAVDEWKECCFPDPLEVSSDQGIL